MTSDDVMRYADFLECNCVDCRRHAQLMQQITAGKSGEPAPLRSQLLLFFLRQILQQLLVGQLCFGRATARRALCAAYCCFRRLCNCREGRRGTAPL